MVCKRKQMICDTTTVILIRKLMFYKRNTKQFIYKTTVLYETLVISIWKTNYLFVVERPNIYFQMKTHNN